VRGRELNGATPATLEWMHLTWLRPLFAFSASSALLSLLACGSSGSSPAAPSDSGALDGTSLDGATLDAATDASPGDASGDAVASDGAAGVDAGPVVGASITVDPTAKLGTIGPGFVGLSYEKSKLQDGFFRGDNTALVAMVDLLGPSVLRIGGNSVDETVWQTFDAGAPGPDAAAPTVITAADVDGLAAFAKAASWKVLYGVNMKISFPSVADSEATYAAGQLGSALYGFEIGNECDLYTTVASSPGAWTYDAFKADWQQFATAIHAGVADAPLTGPASASHYASWTVPFASDEAKAITLLTQHYYVANGQAATSTIELLLQPDPALVTELQALSTAATSNAIPSGYRLSECNSFYNGGAPNVSDAYGTALWAIDFLFTNAQYGSSGANFHGGGDGTGYTPIADANGDVVGARPLFYGMLLFTQAGQGSMLKTTGGPAAINFSSYAVGATGQTSVVLSNKDTTTTVQATVGVAIASASATRLAGPSLSATTGVTLGGVAIGADGSFAPNAPEVLATSGQTFTVAVPPASAVLVIAK
jgi:hypothetical protein